MEPINADTPIKNRLLSALPANVFDRLTAGARTVSLERGKFLYEAEDKIDICYFPNNGMLSLLSVNSEGGSIEVGYVSEEGMVGSSIVMGRPNIPGQVLVQANSHCIAVDAGRVVELFETSEEFRNIVLRFSSVLMKQLSQTCVCNHFHSVESRACRWLSVLCERSGLLHARLTQEFVALILGVRRSSIGTVNAALQQAGVIRYSRGIVEVLDLRRMQSLACECYAIIQTEHRRLVDDLKLTARAA